MTTIDSEWALNLTHVTKTYGKGRHRVQALKGIDLRVKSGEVFGLLGPNGAGKSTLVKILMTVIRPTQCQGTMLGKKVRNKSMLRRVGYLPEHHRFPSYLTGAQVLEHFASMSGMPRSQRKKRRAHLLDLVDMGQWANKKVGGYSKGMRQRLGIASSMMNEPDLILLDEPTDGVDPIGRRDIRKIVEQLREQGKTIFINSHLLSELEQVCDRVAILVQGKVAQQGTLHELTRADRRYEVQIAERVPLSIKNEYINTRVEDRTIVVGSHKPESVQPLISDLVGKGLTIISVNQVRPSLEDLFMRAVEHPPKTGPAPQETPKMRRPI